MSLSSNLRIRLRLLRAVLTKRFIYPDVTDVALAFGNLPVPDVAGDLEPIDLLGRVGGLDARPWPDFSALRQDAMIGGPTERQNWSSERNAAEFIGRFTAALEAGVVIELGCFIGYTSAHIATALRAQPRPGHLHYVDCADDYLAATAANLKRFGLEGLATPHRGTSCDPTVLAELPAAADLIFIDTTHGYDDTRAEIAAYGPRLSSRGCLALHDSIRFPGVRRAVSEVSDRFRICTFATERGNGLSVLLPRR